MLLFGDDGEDIGAIGKGKRVVEIGFADVTTEAVDTLEGTGGIE